MRRDRGGQDETDKARQERREAIENAEKQYQTTVERRDELNGEARVVRDERNALNDRRKAALEGIDELRAKRDELVRAMRTHKARRNELQSRARKMIEEKRKRNKDLNRALPRDLEVLDAEIKALDLKQQTVPMSLAAERVIIDQIREKMHQYIEMQKSLSDQESVVEDLEKLNTTIDELFAQADTEHELVVRYYQESQEYHDRMTEMFNSAAVLIAESKKKHEEYMELKKRADALHQKAVEMRSRVLVMKKEDREERLEARRIMQEQRASVEKALTDRGELEAFEEKTLEELKRSGRISI